MKMDNFRSEKQEKSAEILENAWKEKKIFQTNKGIHKVTFFVRALEGKSLSAFPLLNSTNVY